MVAGLRKAGVLGQRGALSMTDNSAGPGTYGVWGDNSLGTVGVLGTRNPGEPGTAGVSGVNHQATNIFGPLGPGPVWRVGRDDRLYPGADGVFGTVDAGRRRAAATPACTASARAPSGVWGFQYLNPAHRPDRVWRVGRYHRHSRPRAPACLVPSRDT